MKLTELVGLNDGYIWQCIDVQTVIQHPSELQIFTLTNGVNEIRLTQREIDLNKQEIRVIH